MRSIDEQMELILEKAQTKRERDRLRKTHALQGAVTASGLLAVLLAAGGLSRLQLVGGTVAAKAYGSLIGAGPVGGYVLIGTLSFILGAAVTLICIFLAKGGGRKDK